MPSFPQHLILRMGAANDRFLSLKGEALNLYFSVNFSPEYYSRILTGSQKSTMIVRSLELDGHDSAFQMGEQ